MTATPSFDAFRECYDRGTLAQFHVWDNRELLPGIECPSLVLRGAQSTVHGAEAADVSRGHRTVSKS